MTDIKIFVTYKEKHKVLKSDIITPIQTGRAIADEVFEDMIGDDTGDNISAENPKYNELSAQYWVWKHYEEIGNPDYVGFMHYRRHFLFNTNKKLPTEKWLKDSCWYQTTGIDDSYLEYFSDDYILKSIKDVDCIVPKPYDYHNYMFKNLVEDYKNLRGQHIEHFHIMIDTVKRLYPKYSKVAEQVRNGHLKYIANMFVMKKKMFFEYCEFLFNIEKEIDKQIDSKYFHEHEMRFLGFLGEIILTIFILYQKTQNKYKIKELNTCFVLDTEKYETNSLFPAFDKNNIAIACSSSQEYVPYLSVFLQSIKEHTSKDKNYDILIFERSITKLNKEILKRQIEQSNISIRFINPTDLLTDYNLKFPPNYNLECYFRLAAPLILKNYKKVIFTDIDLLFNENPAELYKIEIGKNPLGAVQDYIWGILINNTASDWKEYAINTLELDELYKYFNTGVMLLNVAEFNKNNYSKKLLDLVSKTQFRILEQDGLNKFFKTKIKYIDSAWNYPILNSVYASMAGYMPYEFIKEYKKDRSNPKIIHFAGSEKPWAFLNNEFVDIWWAYARKTPFYEEILTRLMDFKLAQRPLAGTDYNTIYMMEHPFINFVKKISYKIKKQIGSKAHRAKYKEKYNRIKFKLKQIKHLKKQIKKI